MNTRTLAGGLAAGVALLLVIPVVILLTYPMALAGAIQRGVSTSTGFELTLEGLEVDVLPLRIAAQGVQLQNPAADFDDPLLAVERANLDADLSGWWRGSSGWWSADVEGVLLYVGHDGEGRDLWLPAEPAGSAVDDSAAEDLDQSNSAGLAMAFETLRLTNAELRQVRDGKVTSMVVSELAVTKHTDERIELALTGTLQEQPLQASGTLALPTSERAQVVDFEAKMPGGKLSVKGTVGHDGLVPGEAEFTIDLQDLSGIAHLSGQDYTHLQPISVTGRLLAPEARRWELSAEGQLAGEPLRLSGVVAREGPAFQLADMHVRLAKSALRGSGEIDAQDKRLSVELHSDSLDVDALSQLLMASPDRPGTKDEASEPLGGFPVWQAEITASVDTLGYRQYRLQGVSAALHADREDGLKLEGKIARVAAFPERGAGQAGQAPPVSGERDGARSEGDDQPRRATQTAWEIVQPLQFTLQVPQPGQGAGEDVVTLSVRARDFTLDADSAMPSDGAFPDSAMLKLRLESLAAISATGLDKDRWSTFLPLDLSFNASSRGDTVQVDPLEIRLADDRLGGRLAISTAEAVPHISGELQAPRVDVNRFRTTPVQAADPAESAGGGSADDLIPSEPLNWSWLDAVNLDLELLISELTFNQTRLRNLRLQVVQNDAGLTIDPLRADMAVGGVRGSLRIHDSQEVPHIEARLIVTQLTPADLGRKNAGLIDGGATDILVDLRTRGVSPQDLADNLNGELALEVQRAELRNNLFEVIGSDLLVETVSLINPFAKREETTELECAAVYFRAEEGVLISPDQLVIETGKIKIRGGGEIDLKREELQIDFIPRARKGLGLNLSGLASVVRIGGSLGKPRPQADPAGVLTAGASIGAAITTGGVSLLAEGLFDRALASGGTACGKIFEEIPETDIPDALEVDEQDAVSGAPYAASRLRPATQKIAPSASKPRRLDGQLAG